MPLYKIIQGKLWANKRVNVKGDVVILKESVAKSYGLSRLHLLEDPKPVVFVTQPERNTPPDEESEEEVIGRTPPSGSQPEEKIKPQRRPTKRAKKRAKKNRR